MFTGRHHHGPQRAVGAQHGDGFTIDSGFPPRVGEVRESHEPRGVTGLAQRDRSPLARHEGDGAAISVTRAALETRRLVLEEHAAAQLPSEAPPVAAQLDAKYTARRLEAGLAKLPERQRAALLLRSREGMSYSEIAKALGASPSGVKSLIHRAREGLLEILGRERP